MPISGLNKKQRKCLPSDHEIGGFQDDDSLNQKNVVGLDFHFRIRKIEVHDRVSIRKKKFDIGIIDFDGVYEGIHDWFDWGVQSDIQRHIFDFEIFDFENQL